MASGLPLVGARVGGIPAIIAHGRTGLLVNPGDPADLAAAINRLRESAALRAAYGAAARERVEAEFAWPAIATRTVHCYERVLCEANPLRARTIDWRRFASHPSHSDTSRAPTRKAA
jgi:glycosyltransferase involved in cell wall biosynthesis